MLRSVQKVPSLPLCEPSLWGSLIPFIRASELWGSCFLCLFGLVLRFEALLTARSQPPLRACGRVWPDTAGCTASSGPGLTLSWGQEAQERPSPRTPLRPSSQGLVARLCLLFWRGAASSEHSGSVSASPSRRGLSRSDSGTPARVTGRGAQDVAGWGRRAGVLCASGRLPFSSLLFEVRYPGCFLEHHIVPLGKRCSGFRVALQTGFCRFASRLVAVQLVRPRPSLSSGSALLSPAASRTTSWRDEHWGCPSVTSLSPSRCGCSYVQVQTHVTMKVRV